MKILLTLFVLFFSSLLFADDISDFKIEGISIGDSLLDFLSEKDINDEIKRTKYIYSYLNEDFGEVYLYNGLKTYDSMSFFVKPNDDKYLIYEVRGMISFIEDWDGCIKKRNIIVSELSNMFKEVKKTESKYKSRHDPSGKSIKDKVIFSFNNGDQVQVNCSNWEEKLRRKNNWGEGISVLITTNEVISWLSGN